MNEEVRQWLADTADPRTEIVAELCEIIELVDARARGEIKWSAPSYRITDHFATTGFDPRGSSVRLVLHRGVQPHPGMPRPDIDDPDGLLDWKSPDRAIVVVDSRADVEAKRAGLILILRRWVDQTQEPTV